MDVLGLPQFRVLEVRPARQNGDVEVDGVLSGLRDVRNERGWLYRRGGRSIVGDLDTVPTTPAQRVTFVTPEADLAPELGEGVVYPWIDGYWQPYHIDMVLQPITNWSHKTFQSSAAHFFKINGVTGWQPVGGLLPDGAEDLGIRQGAWDHEHCAICDGHIGSGGVTDGYVDPDEHWLCPTCYARFAATHDVSFAID